jgi:hypothetical protein
MFEFFKRWASPAPAPAPAAQRGRSQPQPNKKPPRDPRLAPPLPLPQVVEGNQETDWALWEDSVSALDSQMQGLPSRASGYDKLPSSQFDEADAFASVRKRDR